MGNDTKITVLVVDDSDIIRYSLKNFFQDYNFEVITCLDGLEGIQKSIEYKPSLIFLDLMMPNFDGVKMLQVIKVLDDLKHIPVIVISGNTNKRNVLAALEAGAERVISKPLQKEVIIKHVNEILGEDFLSKSKKEKVFNESENEDIVKQLKTFFLHSFPVKKKALLEALESKNGNLLRTVVHEIKGTGSSIGSNELTNIAADVERKLNTPKIDWTYIKLRIDQIFVLVKELENTNPIPVK